MKNKLKKILSNRINQFVLLLFVCFSTAKAQNLRQIMNEDGLASSAVTSIYQSSDGMLWLGTLDGMNIYYGLKVERPEFSGGSHLEGYIIERIVGADEHTLWVQTGYGLKKIDRRSGIMTDYPQFTGVYMLRSVGQGRAVVLDTKRQLYLYEPDRREFVSVEYVFPADEEILDMGGTDAFFWSAGNKGVYRYNWSETNSHRQTLGQMACLMDDPVKYCTVTSNPEVLYVIDMQDRLYRLDIRRNEKTFILDFGEEVKLRGIPTGIVEKGGTYFVSFKVGGVLKYEYNVKQHVWTQTDLGIRAGVFGMIKDKLQDVIWIASDGQGLFAYWESAYSIHSHRYSDFSYSLGKPVRALFMDNEKYLWIGTKGEGLLGIDRSDKRKEIYQCPQRLLTMNNSPLEDNSVYALSASGHGGFWVGTEKGINFFNYATRSLQKVHCEQEIAYVHSIQEVGDSVLWIATVGTGVFKATIEKSGGTMQLKQFRHFKIDDGVFSSNYFFAMHYTSKGDLWLGNRGHGVFKMYPYGMEPTAWPNKQHSHLQNDVFALYENKDILWIGTSCGLVGLGTNGKEWLIDRNHGLPNNIIRSMLSDRQGYLWVATNNGIARLSPDLSDVKNYGRKDGLLVSEFSDGASLCADDALYFGGVNGWVEISNNANFHSADEYVPPLYFINFKGYNQNINLYLLAKEAKREGRKSVVELEHDENVFSVEVVAVDYVNISDYTYLYKIDSQDGNDWIENGSNNVLSFSQMPPGNYTLHVKYRSHITGFESAPICMEIQIKPLWWQTPFMKFLYWLLFFSIIIYIVVLRYNKVKRHHADELRKLEQQHKDALYEEKLRFFTNITHEFSTPLTLIYTPCERILAHKETDDFVRKYVMLVKKNTERLYQLIQEIIDYRRIETRHQQLNLEYYDLSEYIHDDCFIFTDLAEKNGITLIWEIEENVYWNMDKRCFPKITSNLLSNALKYTPKGGTVKVTLAKLSDTELQLKVYNTGKGIKEEDRIRIFNRYAVLDEVEENASNALSRNGLGMAICHSSVQLLGGNIEINSEVGKYAEFVVTLPLLPLSEHIAATQVKDVMPLALQNREMAQQMPSEPSGYGIQPTEGRPVVLVVDDNKDILFLLREVLSHSYEVKTARSADEALELLRTATPNVILTDVMMPGTDGISLTHQIRQNKHTMHIPLIILSARNTDDAMAEGVQAGADAYIGKPFNVQYLQAVVSRLIATRENMREYYTTSACAYDYVEGQLIKQEDKEFLYQLNEVVEKNLLNSDLTVEMIADALHISARGLYRRLKELNLPSPKDYVKERRMEMAMKLLQTSAMTIQEIIYKCGFNNRAHFYKDFGKRCGMTPKEFRNQTKKPDASLEKESEILSGK